MANIGEQLLSPEVGWKRIDDKNQYIKYTGYWTDNTNPTAYNGSFKRVDSALNHIIEFKIVSSKIRIITGFTNVETSSTANRIIINGIEETFNCEWGSSTKGCMLAYEKIFESIRTIKVKIIVQSGKLLLFDGIDIDENGIILDSFITLNNEVIRISNENENLENMILVKYDLNCTNITTSNMLVQKIYKNNINEQEKIIENTFSIGNNTKEINYVSSNDY